MKILELSVSVRILLAEEIWDSVASEEKMIPLTDAQKGELDARLARYSVGQKSGDSWENVRNRISNSC